MGTLNQMRLHLRLFGMEIIMGTAGALVVLLGVFALVWLKNHPWQISGAPAFCPVAGDEAVTRLLKPIRQKYNVPAIAAAVVTSDGIKFVGAVGVRKRETDVPVGLDDLWHLGSDGKVMTSTLAARLVEEGKLRWDSTLGDIFPELAPKMNPGFRQVTVLELLSHRAGLPANAAWNGYSGKDTPLERLRVTRKELAKTPRYDPGSKFAYSNLGYVIAGAVIEKITGESWENAIANEVFKPLGMQSADFGGTGTPGEIDQPWPHFSDGSPAPENGPDMDNPPVMGPAGCIHCSIQDWARFIQDQLRGARGESGVLLKSESYRKLQTPPFGGDYALGWIVVQRNWAGGNALTHGGDNTMNCADVWVAPKRDFAILVCVNQSGDTAFHAADAAVGAMIDFLNNQPRLSWNK